MGNIVDSLEQKKIRVLHIIVDDKFFDGVREVFESDKRLENQYVLFVRSLDYEFNYIKNTKDVKLVKYGRVFHGDEKKLFQNSDYDVVYFHSFRNVYWHRLEYIPLNKKTIWWTWGFDIYQRGAPLLMLDLYKEETKELYRTIHTGKTYLLEKILNTWGRFNYELYKKKLFSRIDYFQPVLPPEYTLLKKKWPFRMHEFYPETKSMLSTVTVPRERKGNGFIIIGHSASFTSNHLDIWKKISQLGVEGRNFIFPISYGDINTKILKSRLVSDKNNIQFLETLLPYEQYKEMMSSCTHMILGVIRQQGVGNIFLCMLKGIKLFMYKDSLGYQFLKTFNFIVYSIDDMTLDDITTPLTQSEIDANIEAYNKYMEYRVSVNDRAISEIYSAISV